MGWPILGPVVKSSFGKKLLGGGLSFLGGLFGRKGKNDAFGHQLGQALTSGIMGAIQSGIGARLGGLIGGINPAYFSTAGQGYGAQMEQAAFREAAAIQQGQYLDYQQGAQAAMESNAKQLRDEERAYQEALSDKEYARTLSLTMLQHAHQEKLLRIQHGYAHPDRSLSGDASDILQYFSPSTNPWTMQPWFRR